jgi:hypothetical protein
MATSPVDISPLAPPSRNWRASEARRGLHARASYPLRDNLGEEYAAIRPVVEIYPLELTPRLEHEAAGSGRRLFHSDNSGGTSRIFLMARDRSIAFSAEAIAACLLCA